MADRVWKGLRYRSDQIENRAVTMSVCLSCGRSAKLFLRALTHVQGCAIR